MIQHFKWLILAGNFGTPSGERLFKVAKFNEGNDVAPKENELGCAEAVNNINHIAFGDYVGGDISSYRMYLTIINNRKFVQVTSPLQGDIIISPTGFRTSSSPIKHGHVGIVGADRSIYSNDSETGLWLKTYTIRSWIQRYRVKGRYPVYYFRRLTGK